MAKLSETLNKFEIYKVFRKKLNIIKIISLLLPQLKKMKNSIFISHFFFFRLDSERIFRRATPA